MRAVCDGTGDRAAETAFEPAAPELDDGADIDQGEDAE